MKRFIHKKKHLLIVIFLVTILSLIYFKWYKPESYESFNKVLDIPNIPNEFEFIKIYNNNQSQYVLIAKAQRYDKLLMDQKDTSLLTDIELNNIFKTLLASNVFMIDVNILKNISHKNNLIKIDSELTNVLLNTMKTKLLHINFGLAFNSFINDYVRNHLNFIYCF